MGASEPEHAWVTQAAAGDAQAFARLVDLHWVPLHRWLWGLCGKEQLAEDLTQEACFRAWSTLSQLREPWAFRTWLFRIARNLWLDERDKAQRQETQPLTVHPRARGQGPLLGILETEGQRQFQAALARMPLEWREVYLLWSQQHLTSDEVGRLLDVPDGTVRWRLAKARQFLVEQLQPYLDRE